MKKFVAGIIVGILGSALAVWSQQHLASEKVVQPQVLVENAKVKMVRWVLQPGEGTPIHTHTLDHVAVVIRGSTLRNVSTDGAAKENVQRTGEAVYVPGTGRSHSFANAGKDTYESIAIELK